ncbi:MAG: mechanosensitive ion channel [Burkholderiaceae bacterium]|nr:mechanosensitive ion channel [Burkholderiaceae bacterium]
MAGDFGAARPGLLMRGASRRRGLAAALLALLFAWGAPSAAWAQAPAASADAPTAAEPRGQPIAPADIPSRADADEKFAQSVQRRAQVPDKVKRLEHSLALQAAAIARLADLTDETDLPQLSVRRLESVERHWLLKERVLSQTRAELARATNTASEDAAALAEKRAAWQATRVQPYLSPALLQRADELIAQVDRAQALLAEPLAQLLDLGRKGNALAAQVQKGVADVAREVTEQDRRLVTMDSPPLWQAIGEADTGLRRSLEIETAFARDYDAARARLLPVLGLFALGLLPLVFWLRRRAKRLVAAGQLAEPALQTLARPWAAWLLLVAAAAVLYGLQGPSLRHQLVMLLAWIPVLGLLQRRMLQVVGPWAYLSAVFYLLNVVVSLLVGSPLLFRLLLLGINLLMLLTLAWHILRARRSTEDGEIRFQASTWHTVAVLACIVLAIAAAANVVGNISLSTMLVSATLDSSYVALALYASSKVVLALFQVALAGPTAARLSARYSASLAPAVVNIGRSLLVVGWLLFTLQSFRIYRPVAAFVRTVLTHEFKLGELSLSLGSLASFALATWAAFWLAKTIRQVLAEDILPSLSLPRGVGNSVSSLSYYVVLFVGLLAALAAAGFQVGQLALVFGALGVGIGFGLQDVVRNFVAGMILMFERPLQRGDTVEVAGIVGQVREIGLRATVVTTFDGADVIVPNGLLLADKVVNWTLHGTRRRVELAISTTYAADPQRTMNLLLEIARGVRGVATSPEPSAIMTGLAPGELQFSIRAWTQDFTDWVRRRPGTRARRQPVGRGPALCAAAPGGATRHKPLSPQTAARTARDRARAVARSARAGRPA